MGVNYLYPVLSSEDTLIDVEAFLREGQRKWPGCKTAQWTAEEDRLTDADIIITPDGASTIISHSLMVGSYLLMGQILRRP